MMFWTGGRRGGRTALLEWARNIWLDWHLGEIEYVIGAEYPVCPLCFYRRKYDNDESVKVARQVHILVKTAPPLDGPLRPAGPDLATGCRCWRGYNSLRSS